MKRAREEVLGTPLSQEEIQSLADCIAQVAGSKKFEGEPAWAPYFYTMALSGDSDETEYIEGGPTIDVFTVTPADIRIFPDLGEIQQIRLYEDDRGFVHTETIP